MNNIFPVNQCLKPLRRVAFLGNEMGRIFAIVFDKNFDIEWTEDFVEVRIWVRIVLFGGEREREYDWDPVQTELVSIRD